MFERQFAAPFETVSPSTGKDNDQGSPGTKDKHVPAARPQSAPCATYCYPVLDFMMPFASLRRLPSNVVKSQTFILAFSKHGFKPHLVPFVFSQVNPIIVV